MTKFQHSCQARGICQSTTGQCRKACHFASGEPPIGYEAAYSKEWEEDEPDDSWKAIGVMLASGAIVGILAIGIVFTIIW